MYKRQPNYKSDLRLNCSNIVMVTSFRLLGITIDDGMKFSAQCSFVLKKLNSCIHLLCNYRKFLPQHTLKLIFNCVGFPHLHYCLSAYYDFLRKQDIQKLERKYNKCCRIILNDTFSSTDKSLGWLPFTELAEKSREKLLLSTPLSSGHQKGILYENAP